MHPKTLREPEQIYKEMTFPLRPKIFFFLRRSLRKKYPYSELFWSVFSRIWTEYEEIQSISPYSAGMRENTDQNNFDYGHFSHSDYF